MATKHSFIRKTDMKIAALGSMPEGR
jgi:hypothetical protein